MIIYCLLQMGTGYQDLGGNYFDERAKQAVPHRAVKRMEKLGYKIALEAA